MTYTAGDIPKAGQVASLIGIDSDLIDNFTTSMNIHGTYSVNLPD